MTFDEVVFYSVVAAEYHTSYQSQHFLGAGRYRTLGISIGIQVEQPVNDHIILAEYHLVHFAPVFVEFL